MPERSVRKSERTMSDRPVQPVEEVARMQEQMGNMSRKMEKPRKKKGNVSLSRRLHGRLQGLLYFLWMGHPMLLLCMSL